MKKQKEKIEGTIIDVFPDLKFKVKTKDGSEIFAYLSGKMRLHKIKILGGDKVLIEVDEYNEKGRIVYRL